MTKIYLIFCIFISFQVLGQEARNDCDKYFSYCDSMICALKHNNYFKSAKQVPLNESITTASISFYEKYGCLVSGYRNIEIIFKNGSGLLIISNSDKADSIKCKKIDSIFVKQIIEKFNETYTLDSSWQIINPAPHITTANGSGTINIDLTLGNKDEFINTISIWDVWNHCTLLPDLYSYFRNLSWNYSGFHKFSIETSLKVLSEFHSTLASEFLSQYGDSIPIERQISMMLDYKINPEVKNALMRSWYLKSFDNSSNSYEKELETYKYEICNMFLDMFYGDHAEYYVNTLDWPLIRKWSCEFCGYDKSLMIDKVIKKYKN